MPKHQQSLNPCICSGCVEYRQINREQKAAARAAKPDPAPPLSRLAIAGMAVKHFGNPIPPAAYRFADDIIAALGKKP